MSDEVFVSSSRSRRRTQPTLPCTLLPSLPPQGIRKRKRSKLVFDEDEGEWKRRFGYKRGNDDSEVPMIEARADDAVRGRRWRVCMCCEGLAGGAVCKLAGAYRG